MKTKKDNFLLTNMMLCSLFCAATAVCSIISIPIPFTPVPVSLATLSVFMAGGLLGGKYGALSQIIYLLLGTCGVPVFHNFTGGIGILLGPTGGYIFGYVLSASICGIFCKYIFSKHKKYARGDKKRFLLPLSLFGAIFAANLGCYALGTIWFVISTGTSLYAALFSCVFPFVPADILKIALATALLTRLYPIIWNKHI